MSLLDNNEPMLNQSVHFLQPWQQYAPKLWAHWLNRFAVGYQSSDKEAALELLAPHHEQELKKHQLSLASINTCEQVHGADVAVIDGSNKTKYTLGVDALVTTKSGITLGIYVADCAALYLYDHQAGVIGLAHSGRKGTQLNILKSAVAVMCSQGAAIENIRLLISPCIRPPHYPIDIAAQIRQQASEIGLLAKHCTDCMIDTYSNDKLYDSYRRDQGKTGRMLALLQLR